MEAKDNKSEVSNSTANFSTIWLKLGEHQYELPLTAQPNNNGFVISIHPNTDRKTFPQNPITSFNEIHSPRQPTLRGENSTTQAIPAPTSQQPKKLHKKKSKKQPKSANKPQTPSPTPTQPKLTSFMAFQYVGDDPGLKKLYLDRYDSGETFDLNDNSNCGGDVDLLYPLILNSPRDEVELANGQCMSGFEVDNFNVQSLNKKSSLKKKKKVKGSVTKIKSSGKVVGKEGADAINAIQEVHDVINGMMRAYEQTQNLVEAQEKSPSSDSPKQKELNSAKKSPEMRDAIEIEKFSPDSKKKSLVDLP